MPANAAARTLPAVIVTGLVVLLVSPVEIADPFGLGATLWWSIVCASAAAVACLAGSLRGEWPATRLTWPIVAYAAAVAITMPFGVDPWVTVKASVTVAAELGLFYSALVAARRVPRLPETVLLIAMAWIGVTELLAFGYHVEVGLALRPKEYLLPEGWAGYPELGGLAVFAFAFSVALLRTARGAVAIATGAALALIFGTELVLLYSRTTWLAGAVVVAAAALTGERPLKRLLVTAAVVAALAAGAAAASPTVRFLAANLITGRGGAPVVGGPRMDVAAPATRVRIWTLTLAMIGDAPLTGVGLGNFRSVFESEYSFEEFDDGRRGMHAHNLWLHRAAELGIPGGLCYLAVWVGVLWLAYRAAARSPSFSTYALFLALLGTATSELTDNVAHAVIGIRIYLLTWVLFGLAVGVASRTDASEKP